MLLEGGGRAGNSFTKKFPTMLASGFSRIFLNDGICSGKEAVF